jgi:hypothetical protein
VIGALFDVSSNLAAFIERHRDTIQAYVLKNMLKPIFLKGEFDVLMGNPPWLSFRYIRAREYQTELRALLEDYGLAPGAHLATQMDLATLFLARCADWYLGQSGAAGLVMPRSLANAQQHHRFRTCQIARVEFALREFWDLAEVEPLFGVPAAVVILRKGAGARTAYPVSGYSLSGRLPRKNATPEEAEGALLVRPVVWHLNARQSSSFLSEKPCPWFERGPSPYMQSFVDGATLFPRALWFVEARRGRLGADAAHPLVNTDAEAAAGAKPRWRGIRIEAPIEREFLFGVVLSRDAVPFRIFARHTAVVPIMRQAASYSMLDAAKAQEQGFALLAAWITKAEELWARRHGEAGPPMRALERINLWNALCRQSPAPGLRVLVGEVGTYPFAALVESQGWSPLLEHKFYWYEPSSRAEGLYLCSIVNSGALAAAVRDMQVLGQWGERGVGKRVWEPPIPQFDPEDSLHRSLAEMGAACAEKVQQWITEETAGSTEAETHSKVVKLRRAIAHTRKRVRKFLAEELAQIDELVRELLAL